MIPFSRQPTNNETTSTGNRNDAPISVAPSAAAPEPLVQQLERLGYRSRNVAAELRQPDPQPLEASLQRSLYLALGREKVAFDEATLVAHASGATYSEYLRRLHPYPTPGAVIYPASEADIALLMNWAAEREIQLLPWGNGSHPYYGKEVQSQHWIVVNLSRMNKVLGVDVEQRQVRLQAGITWEALESHLATQHMSCGQVFPFQGCTVGGSLATHSDGLKTPGYNALLENVHALRAISPAGPLELHRPQPGENNSLALLFGIYGCCALITEATLELYPLPKERQAVTVGFGQWDTAVSMLDQLLRSGIRPVWARVITARQSALFPETPTSETKLRFKWRLRPNNDAEFPIHLTVAFEGERALVAHFKNQSEGILREAGELIERTTYPSCIPHFLTPHAQQQTRALWHRGFLATVLTASVPWAEAEPFRQDWEEALESVAQATGNAPALAMTAIYAGESRAVLYTLLIGSQTDLPEERGLQFDAIQQVALETKRRWMITSPPCVLTQMANAAIQQTLDPVGIMLRYHGF